MVTKDEFEVLFGRVKLLEVLLKDNIVDNLKTSYDDLLKKFDKLSVDNARLVNENSELKKSLKEFNIKQNSLEAKLGEVQSTAAVNAPNCWFRTMNGQEKKTVEQLSLISVAAKENKEREERENNVMIFGLESITETDIEVKKQKEKDKVKEIISSLNLNIDIKHVRSLKTREDNTAPLVVNIGNKANRNELLKQSKNLRNKTGYEKVFISPDMTEAQRIELKSLITERNKRNASRKDEDKSKHYYGIRGSRIVQIRLPN
jgi:hypothetical protein